MSKKSFTCSFFNYCIAGFFRASKFSWFIWKSDFIHFIFILTSTMQTTPTLILRLCTFNVHFWSLENGKNKTIPEWSKSSIWYALSKQAIAETDTWSAVPVNMVLFMGVATIRGAKQPLVVNKWPKYCKAHLGKAVWRSATMNNNRLFSGFQIHTNQSWW